MFGRWFYALPLVLVPLLLSASFLSFLKNGGFQVRTVEWSFPSTVHLPDFIWNAESRERLQQSERAFRASNLWLLDESAVSEVLGSFEWICHWRARKNWPSSLFIEVELCTIDLWERQEERVRPFYSNGTWGQWYPKFAGADLGLSFEFPRSWGEEEKLLFARRLSSFVKSGNISWLQKAQQARVASDGMIAWQLQKPAVTLLTREDVTGSQMDRVTRVLNFLEKKQIEARVIDATGAKKILVRLRGEP